MSARRLARVVLLLLSTTVPSLAGCARPSVTPTSTSVLTSARPASAVSSVAALVNSVSPVVEQRVEAHGIDYVFRASRLTNLAWQLDCLAGFGRCSQLAYEALWRDRLQREPDLGAAHGLARI